MLGVLEEYIKVGYLLGTQNLHVETKFCVKLKEMRLPKVHFLKADKKTLNLVYELSTVITSKN